MRRIRVLIVDDAATVRRLLTAALAGEPEIQVVGTAANGRLALARLSEAKPDVLILDLAMPEMDGLETLAALRETGPRLPVIVFSSLTRRGASATLEALALGASDYVTKPSAGGIEASLEHARRELVPRILALGGRREVADSGVATQVREAGGLAMAVAGTPPCPPPERRPMAPASRVEVVAIGTSTGGPNALAEILTALPADLPVPLLIVQHMPPLFTAHLAERLDAKSPHRVAEGVEGACMKAGEVWIAPGGRHMVVVREGGIVRLRLHDGPPQHSCRPAVDELFRSAAEAYGAGTLAVLLTGMGQDGARGCERIRDADGQVLVQDEATSVVWGMPGRVAAAGLADAILPLEAMAGEIERRVRSGRRGRLAA